MQDRIFGAAGGRSVPGSHPGSGRRETVLGGVSAGAVRPEGGLCGAVHPVPEGRHGRGAFRGACHPHGSDLHDSGGHFRGGILPRQGLLHQSCGFQGDRGREARYAGGAVPGACGRGCAGGLWADGGDEAAGALRLSFSGHDVQGFSTYSEVFPGGREAQSHYDGDPGAGHLLVRPLPPYHLFHGADGGGVRGRVLSFPHRDHLLQLSGHQGGGLRRAFRG